MSITFDKTGLEAYSQDFDAEQNGIWLSYPEGRQFLIARAGGANRHFKREISKAMRPYRKKIDQGRMNPEETDRILHDVYARTVLLNWKNIKNAEGQEVPYDPDSGVEFFKAFPEIFNELVDRATEAATFLEEDVQEAKEDLGKS